MGGPERQAISSEEARKLKYNPFYKTYNEKATPAELGMVNPGASIGEPGYIDSTTSNDPIDQTFKEVDRKFLAEMSQTKWAKKKGPSHQAASFGSKGKFASDNALADATPWVGDTASSDYTKSIKGDIEGYLQKWRERHGYSS
jgi:hypothetical protein